MKASLIIVTIAAFVLGLETRNAKLPLFLSLKGKELRDFLDAILSAEHLLWKRVGEFVFHKWLLL